MPVTFNVFSHPATVVPEPAPSERVIDAQRLLESACYEQAKQCGELLQSSLDDGIQLAALRASQNGFVRTAVHAYNEHHNLVIRPDDVWIAILTQFNFYVNAHAEELRSHFVSHQGKKTLILDASGTRYTVDFGDLSRQMTDLIHENVVDKSLHGWILPDFTTTTPNDKTVCAVTMMATLSKYFTYVIFLRCGIPYVTLEGQKSDWESIFDRLEKLEEFGPEPAQFASMLRPILQRFISAFDGAPDVPFWKKIAHYTGGGSGPTYLSGWITAFCAWSPKGEWLGTPVGAPHPKPIMSLNGSESSGLLLDGVSYPLIDSQEIPAGYCEVDVIVVENLVEYKCLMVAGHVAMEAVRSITPTSPEGYSTDTVRPSPQWFIFVKGENMRLPSPQTPRVPSPDPPSTSGSIPDIPLALRSARYRLASQPAPEIQSTRSASNSHSGCRCC
ncbi:hypothetical protein BOTBODRAFT_58893 [Botryobasidium botryosum FD-172 SS1]|uniref:DUF4419 domain-containing protein n=1 Tax=Botryobasidium botryosum (strain FD-172 SS1) TaxID=930990 RepID=A0A067M0M4_BOTB1|nr:hypothetical protein BOTBODRAFT_58893 [Botryobasidium botryosum FD-172 SS1]